MAGQSTADGTEQAKAIGRRLAEARRDVGWKRNAAAARMGIKAPSLQRYEDGERLPSLEVLLKASCQYRRPVGWFFGEAEVFEFAAVLEGVDASLADAARRYAPEYQRALADCLPALEVFARRVAPVLAE